MASAGEQIGETIVKLTQENADLSREVERLQAYAKDTERAALKLKATLEAEIARLQSIVDALPKTADGVTMVPGMSDVIEYNQTLAHLRVAAGAVREEPYSRLPTLSGTLTIAAMQFEQLRDEIERLESIIESLRGGTHCRFVGVPCGQCVGCNRDASVEKKIRGSHATHA